MNRTVETSALYNSWPQQAFADLGGAQCGYCTPGILVTAKALLERNPRPTRGQILALEVDKPDLKERVQQGGVVGYIIIGVGLFGLLLALERLLSLTIAGSKVSSQLKNNQPNANNALGRVLSVHDVNKNADTEKAKKNVPMPPSSRCVANRVRKTVVTVNVTPIMIATSTTKPGQ